jgi:hypothetical protein
MKRFIVEQLGLVQVEATRRFVVELPDHVSEKQAQDLVESKQETFPDNDDMAWRDQPDRSWSGYDVEITETHVYDPGAPNTDELRVIRLESNDK